jgi:hypothetical protein
VPTHCENSAAGRLERRQDAADGTCLAILPDRETVMIAIRRHNMEPVPLHCARGLSRILP